jgi:hypothetical protein
MTKDRVLWRNKVMDWITQGQAKKHKVKSHKFQNLRQNGQAPAKNQKRIVRLYIRLRTEILLLEVLTVPRIFLTQFYGLNHHLLLPSPVHRDQPPQTQIRDLDRSKNILFSKCQLQGRIYLQHMTKKMKLLQLSREISRLP